MAIGSCWMSVFEVKGEKLVKRLEMTRMGTEEGRSPASGRFVVVGPTYKNERRAVWQYNG